MAEIPHCVRWRQEDLDKIRLAAAESSTGAWIRARVVERLDMPDAPVLDLVPAGDRILCVRFPPEVTERVREAASAAGLRTQTWVRAVAVGAANR